MLHTVKSKEKEIKGGKNKYQKELIIQKFLKLSMEQYRCIFLQ